MLPSTSISTPAAPQSGEALARAAATLGVRDLDTLEVTAQGSDYLFGQAYDGQSAWPRFNVPSYSLWLDYRLPAFREERTRTQSFNPPATPGAEPNAVPNLVQFHEVVQRLALDVDRVVPLHGRMTTWDELLKAVETYGQARSRPTSDRSTR